MEEEASCSFTVYITCRCLRQKRFSHCILTMLLSDSEATVGEKNKSGATQKDKGENSAEEIIGLL